MKNQPPIFDPRKFHVPLLFIAACVAILPAFFSVPDLQAQNDRNILPAKSALGSKADQRISTGPSKDQKAIRPKSQSVDRSEILDKSAKGPKAGQLNQKNQFQSGFDSTEPPSWSRWEPVAPLADDDFPQQSVGLVPLTQMNERMALGKLERYQTSPTEEPLVIAMKVDDILGNARDVALSMTFGNPKTHSLAQEMMNSADDASKQTDAVYRDIHSMYMSVDMMKLQLSRNYEVFNASEKTENEASQFNTQSDAMADRTAGMFFAIKGMRDQTAGDREILAGMMEVLDEMAANGKNDFSYYDKVYDHLKNVTTRFDGMAKDLAAQGASNPASVEQARKYLLSLQDYVKGHKPHANSEIDYLANVKKYVQNVRDYLDKVLADLDKTEKDLKANEEYFRKAKVTPEGSSRDIEVAPMGGDICSAPIDQYKEVNEVKIKKTAQELEKDKPLKDLQSCQKDCRTVCRFKDKRGGQNCYECPSGSPGSCYDVGGWPANHPWCQPGGACYDDPMMYCSPYGAVGPNKEKLQCTTCKVRPDMCAQKVGGGMTLTNCKLGCWNGKCVYKGKYQEFEWDGKLEWVHCFECKLPPGPPSCEDMKWGTTWYGDCKKGCPDPGDCKQKNTQVPGKPKPPPVNNPPPPGNNPPGDGPGNGPQGGESGGGTEAGGGGPASGGNTGGKPFEPPPGTPEQPGSGASTGGGQAPTDKKPTGDEPKPPTDGGAQKPGDAPPSSEPRQPSQLNTGDQPQPPPPPPPPPDTPQISMYRDQLAATEERIKSREKIINDPNEPDSVKDSAREQLESMTRDRDAAKKRLEDEQKKEIDKIKDEEERKRRTEEWERTRVRTPDYAEEARKRGEVWLLTQLRNATKALEDKLQEAKDAIAGRRARLERIRQEIAQLEVENKHYTEGAESGNVDSDVAKTQTKANLDRIKQLKQQYVDLDKKLKEATQQFNEELARLKSDYRRALWAYDKKSQARADAERTDEYFERYNELQHAKATRAERNRTFDEIAANMETAIRDKKVKGEDTDELELQLENMKRGQVEWNASIDRQEEGIKNQLHELERRNFYEGAGPSSAEHLGESLAKFGKDFQNQLTQTNTLIADLEKNTTRTKEQNDLLGTLKAKVNDLQNSINAVAEKQAQFKSGALTAEEQARVHESTLRVANGVMNTNADKSFLRLFGESLAEEGVHNLNPYVAAKKSLAFGVGVVQGVGTAVVGLVELGVGAVDLTMEMYLTNLGFDIETDALDTVNNLIDTVSSNANFDGVIKAVVAAGGAIDAKLTELGKGDIDWNTAKFGGEVAGELVVADKVIAAGLGKAGEALGLIDEGIDAARAGTKLDEAATTAGTTERAAADAASHLDDTKKFPAFEPPPGGVADDAGQAGRTVGKVDDAPTRGPPAESPKTQAVDIEVPKSGAAVEPPTGPGRGGVHPNSQATYVGPDGKTVTLQTGEELGHGSTSVVYADAADKTKAIRITEPGKGGITTASELDVAGRKAVESVQKPGGPIRIVDPGKPVMVNDPTSPLNGKIVEVVERAPNGDASQFLAKNGGQMSEGQAKAVDAATRELNKNGYAWMDNHTGNYGFEKVEGTVDDWTVVVLDPGGIVPMKGLNAEDAFALQRHLNTPEEGMADFVKMAQEKRAKWTAEHPGEVRGKDMLDNIIDAERSTINNTFGSKIDANAMGLNDASDVAYYPFGTLDYPDIQALGRMK